MTFALNRLAARVGDEQVAATAGALEQLPAFAEAVKTWRSLPSRQPSGKLAQLAADKEQTASLFAIIHDVIDRADTASTN